jgi:hypothetical protein
MLRCQPCRAKEDDFDDGCLSKAWLKTHSVISGSAALRSACTHTTRDSLMPLAQQSGCSPGQDLDHARAVNSTGTAGSRVEDRRRQEQMNRPINGSPPPTDWSRPMAAMEGPAPGTGPRRRISISPSQNEEQRRRKRRRRDEAVDCAASPQGPAKPSGMASRRPMTIAVLRAQGVG